MVNPWEVDNSSRVISSVAIRALRYSGWSLADMRIHDINLVADLTAHDPNDPFPADGTTTNKFTENQKAATDQTTTHLVSTLTNGHWGQEVWPKYHIVTYAPTVGSSNPMEISATSQVLRHTTYDLLNNIEFVAENTFDWAFGILGQSVSSFESFLTGAVSQIIEVFTADLVLGALMIHAAGWWVICDSLQAAITAGVLAPPSIATLLSALTGARLCGIAATLLFLMALVTTAETVRLTLGWDFLGGFLISMLAIEFFFIIDVYGNKPHFVSQYDAMLDIFLVSILPKIFFGVGGLAALEIISTIGNSVFGSHIRIFSIIIFVLTLALFICYGVSSYFEMI